MSLMRLLTMSHSVNGTSDMPHRYKVMGANALPKFAPAGRTVSLAPVKEKKIQEKENMNTPSLFEATTNAESKAGEPKSAAEPGEMQILSVGVFVPKLNRLPEPTEGWFAKIKNLFSRKKPEPTPTRAVQTEWPMDRITVVRNDLSDSDFEVVWAEGSQPQEAPVERPRKEQLVGRAWKKAKAFTNSEPVETPK